MRSKVIKGKNQSDWASFLKRESGEANSLEEWIRAITGGRGFRVENGEKINVARHPISGSGSGTIISLNIFRRKLITIRGDVKTPIETNVNDTEDKTLSTVSFGSQAKRDRRSWVNIKPTTLTDTHINDTMQLYDAVEL